MVRQELDSVRAAVVLAHRAVDASQVVLALVRCEALGADRHDVAMPDGSMGEPGGERQALYGAAVRWLTGAGLADVDRLNLGPRDVFVHRGLGLLTNREGYQWTPAPESYRMQVALALIPGLAPHLAPDQADILRLIDEVPAAAGAVAAGALCRTAYAAVAAEVLPLLVDAAKAGVLRSKVAAVPDGEWRPPGVQSTAVTAQEKAALMRACGGLIGSREMDAAIAGDARAAEKVLVALTDTTAVEVPKALLLALAEYTERFADLNGEPEGGDCRMVLAELREHLEDPAPAPGAVWLLTWGGGDEPESPSLSAFMTKAGALRGAADLLASIGAEGCCRPAADVLADLEASGEANEAGAADAFMRIESLQVIS